MLGLSKRQLDWIRAGREPDEAALERLRLVRELSREADLRDPQALAGAVFGASEAAAATGGLRLLWRGPYRWALIAFLAVDALLFLGILAYALYSFG